MKFWLNNFHKILNKTLANYLIIWLVVLVVARFPSLFDALRGGDEDYYMVIAQSLANGKWLYVDIWDNKPPLLYLVYLANYVFLGPSLFGVRLLGLVLSILSLISFKKVLELQIFNISKIKTSLVFSLIAFFVSFGWQTVIFNAENLFLPLIIFGVYYLLKNIDATNQKSAIEIGSFTNADYYKGLIWLSLAGFVKMNALIEALAILFLYLVIYFKRQVKSFNNYQNYQVFFKASIFGLGFVLVPYLVLIAIYGLINKLPQLYFGIFGFGGEYVDKTYLYIRIFLYLSFVLMNLFLFFKSKISDLQFFIWNLCAIEVFAILLSGRGYHHYLIQGFLGFGLIFALCLKNQFKILKSIILGLSVIALLINFLNRVDIWNGFGTDTNYGLFSKVLTKQVSMREWQLDNRWEVELSETLVPLIQSYTKTSDTIYVFANIPFIYSLSNRFPAYSYPVEYQYHEPLKNIFDKVKINQAKLIILDKRLERYPQYKELIESDYKLDQIINTQWEVYLVN